MAGFRFTRHAKFKFLILKSHGFQINIKQIIDAVKHPERKEKTKKNRMIAQKSIDSEHILRVIYEKANNKITIVTFYPGRKSYYEN